MKIRKLRIRFVKTQVISCFNSLIFHCITLTIFSEERVISQNESKVVFFKIFYIMSRNKKYESIHLIFLSYIAQNICSGLAVISLNELLGLFHISNSH